MIEKKFTAVEAAKIRWRYKYRDVTYKSLAALYEADPHTIRKIVKKTSYTNWIEDDFDCGVILRDFDGWTVTTKFIINWHHPGRFVKKGRLVERGWIEYYFSKCNSDPFEFARAYFFSLNYFNIPIDKVNPYVPDIYYTYRSKNDDGQALRQKVEEFFKRRNLKEALKLSQSLKISTKISSGNN